MFTGADIGIIRSPIRAPRANAIAERFIGTLRRECLDHILITGPRHLDAVLREFTQHYNAHRPHRSLHQRPPAGATPPLAGATIRPLRRDRLGGLICECCCGTPGWRTTRLGAGDRSVTRPSGSSACPVVDLSAAVAGTGLAHHMA